jgi:uncharacterized membrane protein YhaH (DUF805 family)
MNIDWANLYTNAEGRIGRTTYWIGIAGILVLQLLSYLLFGSGGLFAILSRVVITLLGLAVLIKRCHDWGQTGWLSLVSFIPFIGTLWIIALGVLPGQRGPNAYGPDPRGARAAGTGTATIDERPHYERADALDTPKRPEDRPQASERPPS